MNQIRVFRHINNLEIISKIMNSVAKQCGCRVKYDAKQKAICFYGDTDCQQYIAEQTLDFFRTV